jgi:hypothetical protein
MCKTEKNSPSTGNYLDLLEGLSFLYGSVSAFEELASLSEGAYYPWKSTDEGASDTGNSTATELAFASRSVEFECSTPLSYTPNYCLARRTTSDNFSSIFIPVLLLLVSQ